MKGEVVYSDMLGDIGEDGVVFFVYGEEEVVVGCEVEVGDVFVMGEWKSIGFVILKSVSLVFFDI